MIADVSGHNIGAALIMAETRTLIQASKSNPQTPDELFFELNNFFYDDLTRTELFISMFYLSIDCKSQVITYANAGHNHPLIWRKAERRCEVLDAEGLILGVKKNVKFEQKTTQLTSGDILLMYTDGITEAERSDNEFFGDDRLKALLESCADYTPDVAIDKILEHVRLFTGDHNFIDDVSLVIIKAE